MSDISNDYLADVLMKCIVEVRKTHNLIDAYSAAVNCVKKSCIGSPHESDVVVAEINKALRLHYKEFPNYKKPEDYAKFLGVAVDILGNPHQRMHLRSILP